MTDEQRIVALVAKHWGVTVAVLDSGVHGTHPHFARKETRFGPVANLEIDLPLRVARLDQTSNHIMIDGNTAAALGCVFAGATVAAALLMAVARRVTEAERYVHEGKWKTWGPMTLLGVDILRRRWQLP